MDSKMECNKVVKSVKEFMLERDYRLTPQREAILKVLLSEGESHPSAEEIYFTAKSEHPEIGLATVYRTLEIFCTIGIANKLEVGETGARYEFNNDIECHYHHHLICISCGKIVEFKGDFLEEVEQMAASKTGFKITDHSLRFFGYCQECLQKRD